jgi:hypothetical protein
MHATRRGNALTLLPLVLAACFGAAAGGPPAAGGGEDERPGSAVGLAADPVGALDWLAGCWEGTLSSGAVYEELWLPPRAGTLLGLARMTRDGRTLSFEFMRIFDDDGTLVFAAQPSGRPPTHFRATHMAPGSVTFENPGHDFPQRVLYRHVPPDQLRARIEGERDGQEGGMDFPLRRVACPG